MQANPSIATHPTLLPLLKLRASLHVCHAVNSNFIPRGTPKRAETKLKKLESIREWLRLHSRKHYARIDLFEHEILGSGYEASNTETFIQGRSTLSIDAQDLLENEIGKRNIGRWKSQNGRKKCWKQVQNNSEYH
jgi:hypothetical protein